jgi:hypothetical protein
MAAYLEFNFKIKPLQPWNEILMAELIEIGFDSFTEEYDGVLGYIQKDIFNEDDLKSIPLLQNPDVTITYSYEEMPNINWNEEWERIFRPLMWKTKSSSGQNFMSRIRICMRCDPAKNVFWDGSSSNDAFDDSTDAGYGFGE